MVALGVVPFSIEALIGALLPSATACWFVCNGCCLGLTSDDDPANVNHRRNA